MKLTELERHLKFTFKNQALLKQALTHRSVRGENNERLEFLGDSILNFVIAHALYQYLPHAKEGDLSRFRAALVCEDSLADLALEFRLSDFLILGHGELRTGGFRRKSILADALEAIIAAIYLDTDLITCQRLVANWFKDRLEKVAAQKIMKDSKSLLQEYLQAKKIPLPHYDVVNVTGKDHDQTFHVACYVEGIKEKTEGHGSSRRIAEQEAAALFLKKLLSSS